MQQSPQNSSSQNDCYSTNEQYFLDLCRFGQFQQIKQFISSLSQDNKLQWNWTSNSGDNFIHMLAGNNFPEIFDFLLNVMKDQKLTNEEILDILNKQNSSGSTPLHYSIVTGSKQMLLKLLWNGCDPNIQNEFKRTALAEAEMIQNFQLAEILAPVTKQDIEKLKKQFGGLQVCDENDSSQQEEDRQQKSQEKQQ